MITDKEKANRRFLTRYYPCLSVADSLSLLIRKNLRPAFLLLAFEPVDLSQAGGPHFL
jgi:hypothetical protein